MSGEASVDNQKHRGPKLTPPTSDDEKGSSTKRDSGSSDDEADLKTIDKKDEKENKSTPSVTNKNYLDYIQTLIAEKLRFHSDDESDSAEDSSANILPTVDFKGVLSKWKSGGFKNIITMVGAGISTSSGIPDFRSPKTGLYNNLQKYQLPYPSAIFELEYFRDNPQPFFALAKELYPGTFKPTPCHYFIRLLHEKGLLTRHYTQNIDTLERIAGIPHEALVEAHGTFYTNHCVDCQKDYTMEWVKEEIFADRVPTCQKCNGIVKPDIVFFGEDLPARFHTLPQKDFKKCDLLIIMGTSLEVQPFASLVDNTNRNCVRLLINREKVGVSHWYSPSDGLKFDKKGNKTDVAWLGDCDEGVQCIAKELGLEDELKELVEREHKHMEKQSK